MKEEFMRLKLLVVAAGFDALATPALAAEFYIVQDTGTKRCTIVEQKPTSQTTVVVDNGRTFTTRQEAEGAMKTVKGCESGGTVGGTRLPPPPRLTPPRAKGRNPRPQPGLFFSTCLG